MMLATWLVEFYLSKCNELDDIIASESVSQDVENLQTERTILEDDLRHFFDTYKVRFILYLLYVIVIIASRVTSIGAQYMSLSKDMAGLICTSIMRQQSAIWRRSLNTGFSRKTGRKPSKSLIVRSLYSRVDSSQAILTAR